MGDLPAETIHEVESLVTDWLHENDVPGASLIVVDAEAELYAEGFGARDLESNAPATPDTLYGMGSITKSLTALSIVQLAEADALSVEDAVNEYIDHYTNAPGDAITISDLLSHTSGMPASSPGLFVQSLKGFPAGIADETDFERFVRDSTASRATDSERFFYYNTGYAVLGRLIEAVDGRPYSAYVREEIFHPLGMERATFDPDVLADDDDAMTGYRPGDDENPPKPTPFPVPELVQSGGGLIASVRDLSLFLRAMMADGSLAETRVCSADGVNRLQQGRTVRRTFLDETEEEYGYGWSRRPVGTGEVVGHGGANLVSSSYAGYLPDAGIGVVMACNTSSHPSPTDLGMAILTVLTDQTITTVPAYALKEKCEAVTGTYEAFRDDLTVVVDYQDGGLSITFETKLGDQKVRAFPTTLDPEDYEFYTVSGGGTREQFEFDLSGEQAELYSQHTRVRRTGSYR